jgi:hypothetical protein
MSCVAARTNPTASNLRRAARELTNWKDLAKITGEVEGPEFKALEQALAELWKNIGYSIATDGSGGLPMPKTGDHINLPAERSEEV